MALNGIQIFKLTPKKNCKECGCPTCMAFSMKVAQGAMKIEQCPHMSDEALASLIRGYSSANEDNQNRYWRITSSLWVEKQYYSDMKKHS